MVRILLAGVLIAITTIGCASKGPLSETEKLDYKGRVVTSSDGDVLVSASVLSADESRDIYGVPLAKKGIQPVWIEVENGWVPVMIRLGKFEIGSEKGTFTISAGN